MFVALSEAERSAVATRVSRDEPTETTVGGAAAMREQLARRLEARDADLSDPGVISAIEEAPTETPSGFPMPAPAKRRGWVLAVGAVALGAAVAVGMALNSGGEPETTVGAKVSSSAEATADADDTAAVPTNEPAVDPSSPDDEEADPQAGASADAPAVAPPPPPPASHAPPEPRSTAPTPAPTAPPSKGISKSLDEFGE
jgi:hypothetical protein